jgi:cytochrome c oxidase subunit 2
VRPPAEAIASLGWFVGAIAFVILIGVEGALIWAAWRYRASRMPGPAPQIHGSTRLEIAWTAIPLVVLAVVFVLMLGTMREISSVVTWSTTTAPSGVADLRVLARGYQWWWEYRYTTTSGEVVAANELHIPVGVPVDLALEAHDVIHSFWVPELNGKTDMIPGRINHLRLYAARAGAFSGQCAEFCGLEHAWMRISVIADEPADFTRWLTAQATPRLPPSGAVAEAGERVFTANVCASCHTIRGTGAAGLAGPDLTHVGSRLTLGAGVLANDDTGMRAWIADPQRYKPGVFMPQVPLSAADLTALIAYLRSLQ